MAVKTRVAAVVAAMAVLGFSLLMAGCGRDRAAKAEVIRVGYFPNITHAQALVGLADGTFKQALGSAVTIEPRAFNAGPSVIQALFAGEIDLAYIGPGPAITGYIKSRGEALRVVAGAAGGGAALIMQPGIRVDGPSDLGGLRIATPQLGNTQDVALRHYLQTGGLSSAEKGGNVRVLPIANPDILTLFLKKEIDGAWVPEPWAARLVREGGGVLALDERDLWPGGKFATALVIADTRLLNARPDLVRAWLAAHVDLTRRINADPNWARSVVNAEIRRLTGKSLPEGVLNDAWQRLELTYDPVPASLEANAQWAWELGFLGKDRPDLGGLCDLRPLNEVLKEKGLPPLP